MLSYGLRIINYELLAVLIMNHTIIELSLLAEGMFIAQLIPNYIIPNRRSRQLKIRNLLYEI